MRQTVLSILSILAITALSLLQSCGGGNANHSVEGEKIELRHAKNISMTEIRDGVTLVELKNPWDSSSMLGRYALVDKSLSESPTLPEGVVEIKVPIERSVVFSGVHTALLNELGTLQAVNGMCDVNYLFDSATKEAVSKGLIEDCGSNTMPKMEKIVTLRPEVIILSPYEKSDDASKFARTGIKIVEAADYMEPSPLGRAEWMRFYGRLYGKAEIADSLFNSIEQDYLSAKQSVKTAQYKPSVMFDRIYNGVWDAPTSESVTGQLLSDAGGMNPFEDVKGPGPIHLAPEEMLMKGGKSDKWLIRHFEKSGLTLSSLKADNKLYSGLKPYQTGEIYEVNTLEKPIFEDGAFHPNLILRELIRIIHPEIDPTPLQYYSIIKKD